MLLGGRTVNALLGIGYMALGARGLGVTQFGQSGDLAEVYRLHGLDTDSIVRAGLDLA